MSFGGSDTETAQTQRQAVPQVQAILRTYMCSFASQPRDRR
jgi:hypothetical protein